MIVTFDVLWQYDFLKISIAKSNLADHGNWCGIIAFFVMQSNRFFQTFPDCICVLFYPALHN